MTDDPDRVGWAVLVAASLGALLCFLNLSALNVALPAVARSLHASPTQASWILLSYMLASTVCILSFGRLADLWGRRHSSRDWGCLWSPVRHAQSHQAPK